MRYTFTRWLPAIAQNSSRKTVLTVAGIAALGGLALGPAAVASPLTGEPNPDAVSAINTATGRTTAGAPANPDTAARQAERSTTRPGIEKLIPYGVQGAQSSIALDDDQRANAKAIIDTAKRTGVGERGAVIGVATALQESKLYNLGHLGAINDHDSQGLFQQRPSSGWGTPEQITDPEYASTAFFNGLKNVPGWRQLPLTVAAQTVQVSAYPFAYAQWEQQAAEIVQELWHS
ncbi:hypothetical protein [Micromonospora echinofusca]|uniref:Secreted protein n=1 Tax=Micromonospora echinofusca TaxID=47858 RepID=A0ABS3W1D9_MICEH|nr:hypothetical protein [Micromonospora echinofusca]MBO4210614.1 hypothetical protein [Micromonospora echinofusca]